MVTSVPIVLQGFDIILILHTLYLPHAQFCCAAVSFRSDLVSSGRLFDSVVFKMHVTAPSLFHHRGILVRSMWAIALHLRHLKLPSHVRSVNGILGRMTTVAATAMLCMQTAEHVSGTYGYYYPDSPYRRWCGCVAKKKWTRVSRDFEFACLFW